MAQGIGAIEEKPILETQYQRAARKRLGVASLLIFCVLPLLIGLGILMGRRWYLPVSILMLVFIMAPFFMIFERRKPKAREIVLVAVMSAIVVSAHLIFHLALPIHIGTALVIVSGIALGPEAGFLVGALSRFVCNFYLGQGAWTPWQMFCWGILGFFAGLAFNRREVLHDEKGGIKKVMAPVLILCFFEIVAYISLLVFPSEEGGDYWRFYLLGAIGIILGVLFQKQRLPVNGWSMTLFTFASTFIIYGGIMNIATLMTSMSFGGVESETGGLSLSALKALYISGLPYDMVHASTAAACVFFFGEPLIRKLERIKIKYGIYK